ncbi:hypothetical protein TIFTF001_016835 [Ficus carica]|uniref:Uncharacterized protein n=1 Tax=Ficus carica TaxID=3494 RepID=A0AA88APL1_FICCA|nr:hypothetical protein TIFTF001_016835 [Ficus carica]
MTPPALPFSSFDRRTQCRHPLPLILPTPSTPPSPLSLFFAATVATSTATLSSHQGRELFCIKEKQCDFYIA